MLVFAGVLACVVLHLARPAVVLSIAALIMLILMVRWYREIKYASAQRSILSRGGPRDPSRPNGLRCYLFGILYPLAYLSSNRDGQEYFTRFHCFQCLLLFAVWIPVLFIQVPFAKRAWACLELLGCIGWIAAMTMAARGKLLRLPLIGIVADQLARRGSA